MQDLSSELRQIALDKGLNQAGLARYLGVSQPTISRLSRLTATRRGPAYRRIVTRIKELRAEEGEYSSIQEAAELFEKHIDWLRPSSEAEMVALDKLLSAIERYIAVKIGLNR